MLLSAILDRLCFWNLPGFIKSYELPVAHRSFVHAGLEVWQIPGSEDGPTVLFCHGNAGNLRFPKARGDRFMALHQARANLWVFDYRGYGYSSGKPTEMGLYEDAKAIHALVREQHRPDRPFVLFGRSLGGAVASFLATEVQMPDAMILESTFTSAPDVCAKWAGRYLADAMTYQFSNLSRIPKVSCPLYMIHGTADLTVRHDLGEKLFAACPSAREFVSVKGAGHNNLQSKAQGLYEEKLTGWLAPSSFC